ncbi:hypothetical protein ACWEOW_23600 [Monashia sp. NPDC004114]
MHRPSRTATFVLGALAAASVLATTAAVAATSDDLLRAPIQGSLPTDPKPFFGSNPGGAPWQITSGEAKVQADGTLKVSIVGLVIPGVGTGPVVTVSASVACNNVKAATTGTVPLSSAGNAEIKATLNVPARCLGPAVLIHPNGNAATYIAMTGR